MGYNCDYSDIRDFTKQTMQSPQQLENSQQKEIAEIFTNKVDIDAVSSEQLPEYFSFSDEMPPIRNQGSLGSCFTGDILITMGNLSEKKIKDIEIGETVSNKYGQHKKVIRKYERNYTGELYKIKFNGHDSQIVCTEEHPFAIKQFIRHWNGLVSEKESWVIAKDIDLSNQPYITIPKLTRENPSYNIIKGHYKEDKTNFYSKISSIEKTYVENIPVYNLEVEDDHEYIANFSLVHNCTSFAVDGFVSYFNKVKNGKTIPTSTLYTYKKSRDLDNSKGDVGSYLRTAAKCLVMYGWVDEKRYPYITSKYDYTISRDLIDYGEKNQAISYIRIDSKEQKLETLVTELKKWMVKKLPVMFGFSVYDSINQSNTNGGLIPYPSRNDKLEGGHAVVMCFTKDTKVSLLDGTERSFEELNKLDTPFWVYSCNENGDIVPGLAHSVRKTGNKKQLIKITLDSEEIIKCTEEHPFLMRNGTYKPANKLNLNDSLMPLYRKSNKFGYKLVFSNNKQKYELIHNMVYYSSENEKSEVIHHSDFNKLNNSPENLVGMTWNDHTKLHNKYTMLLEKYSKSDKGRQKSQELMNKLWSNEEWRSNMMIKNKVNAEKGRYEYKLKNMYKEPSIKKQILQAIEKRNNITNNAIRNLKEYNEKIKLGIKKTTQKQINTRKINGKNNLTTEQRSQIAIKVNQKRWNHKVKSIEYIGKEDVYDLTVEKYHNFALSVGVFVHNCGYDDNIVIKNKNDSRSETKGGFIFRNSWSDRWGKCLHGDTKISLLDGTERRIEELTNEGNPIWVYSYDISNNKVVPALAIPKFTGYRNDIVEITLDNEESVVCTKDHLFMLRNGTYKEAGGLDMGDSLMPLYRNIRGGYERFINNNKQTKKQLKYIHTHKMVSSNTNVTEELIHTKTCNKDCKFGTHHIDQNKRNNTPNNLIKLFQCNHMTKHNDNARKQIKLYNEGLKSGKYQLTEKQIQSHRNNIYKNGKQYQNHKVINVKELEKEIIPVYDLTVEKYHNFALSVGVFVHNSGIGILPYKYVSDQLGLDFWTFMDLEFLDFMDFQ